MPTRCVRYFNIHYNSLTHLILGIACTSCQTLLALVVQPVFFLNVCTFVSLLKFTAFKDDPLSVVSVYVIIYLPPILCQILIAFAYKKLQVPFGASSKTQLRFISKVNLLSNFLATGLPTIATPTNFP